MCQQIISDLIMPFFQVIIHILTNIACRLEVLKWERMCMGYERLFCAHLPSSRCTSALDLWLHREHVYFPHDHIWQPYNICHNQLYQVNQNRGSFYLKQLKQYWVCFLWKLLQISITTVSVIIIIIYLHSSSFVVQATVNKSDKTRCDM